MTSKKHLALGIGLSLMSASFTANSADSTSLNEDFLDSIQARDAGNLFRAIQKLENMLVASPNLGRARLELAVAYYRAALFDKARAAAEKVMADPNTPTAVKETVSLFLAEVDAQEQAVIASAKARHKFTGLASLGLGYDDNVNAGPSGSTITIGGTELALTPGSTSQTDAFHQINLRLNHDYSMQKMFNIGAKPVKGVWQSTLGYYRKSYDDINDFNVDVFTVGTGPALLSQTDWRAKLFFQADYIKLGDDELGTYFSIIPSYTLVRNDTEYSITGQWLNKDFTDTSNANLEGERYGATFDITHKFNEKLSGRVGAGYYETDAAADFKSSDESLAFADIFYSAWTDGVLYARAEYKANEYDGQEPIFLVARDDERTTFTVGASHSFNEGKWQNWGLTAKATFTENESNVAIYDYDREQVVAEISRKF